MVEGRLVPRSVSVSPKEIFSPRNPERREGDLVPLEPKSQGSPNLILEVRGSANLKKNLKFVQFRRT